MDNKDIAKEWFKIAKTDLSSAQFLQSMSPVPIEIICYHCQQSAEKYLKGFLALKGEEIKKTHDLVQLNKICQR
jgi:HEPN domain-containing protein